MTNINHTHFAHVLRATFATILPPIDPSCKELVEKYKPAAFTSQISFKDFKDCEFDESRSTIETLTTEPSFQGTIEIQPLMPITVSHQRVSTSPTTSMITSKADQTTSSGGAELDGLYEHTW